MAPQRVRVGPEDSRSEASSTKEKQQLGISSFSTASKARRAVNSAAITGSNLKDVVIAPTVSDGLNGQQGSVEETGVRHGRLYTKRLTSTTSYEADEC